MIFFAGDDEVDESSMTFFHGRLRIHIIEAADLPDTDTAFFNIDGKDFTDAYVTGDLGEARLFKTKYIPNELNPHWDEKFNIHVCHHATSLNLRVGLYSKVLKILCCHEFFSRSKTRSTLEQPF